MWSEENIIIKNQRRIWKNPLKDWVYKYVWNKRSLPSNNYYWLLIWLVVVEYEKKGYMWTTDIIHLMCKTCFLPKVRIYNDFNAWYRYGVKSTRDLKDPEMSVLITRLKLFAEHNELHQLRCRIKWKIYRLEEIGGFILPNNK